MWRRDQTVRQSDRRRRRRGRLDGRTDGWTDAAPIHPSGPALSPLPPWWPLLTTSSSDGCLKCKSVFQLVGGACQRVSLLSVAAAEVEEQEEQEEEEEECRSVSPGYTPAAAVVTGSLTAQ